MQPDGTSRPDDSNNAQEMGRLSRRQWLGMTGLAGTGLLAGCGNDGSGNGNGGNGNGTNSGGSGDNQTFRTTMSGNPAEMLYQPARPRFSGWLDGYTYGGLLTSYLHDYGAYGPFSNLFDWGDKRHTIIEDISIEPTEISWTFKDGATFANGNQITGRDSLATHLHFQLFLYSVSDQFMEFKRGETKPAGQGQWNSPIYAVTDVEADGRTARLKSEPGWFTEEIITSEPWIWSFLITGRVHGVAGHWYDTSVEPRKTWADRAFEFWEMVQNDAVPDDFPGTPEYHRQALMDGFEELGVDTSNTNAMAEWVRDPENMKSFTTGAYMLKEWNGTRSIVLEKNPEYFFADRVNIPRVEIRSRPEERANWASLKADAIDLYNRGTVPANTADSFPDSIEQRRSRANGGRSIAYNCSPESTFGDVRVRQAITQLLDTPKIADAVHEDLHEGVSVVGGHYWRSATALPGGQDWIDANLHDYATDEQLATQLLRDAGWSKQKGNWVDDEGETVTVSLPTTNNTPDYEVALTQQLNDFGIEASIATQNNQDFNQGLSNGDFEVWVEPNYGVGWFRSNHWHLIMNGEEKLRNSHGIFSQETMDKAVEVIEEQDTGSLWPVVGEEGLFTMEVPPIGDWEKKTSGFEEIPIGEYVYWGGSTLEEKQRIRETKSWIENWYLPFTPLTQSYRHVFIDTQNFEWPDEEMWEAEAIGASGYSSADLVGSGLVQARSQ